MRSLQLLCTVGGNQARLDARTEFENLEPSLRGGVEAGRTHHCIKVRFFQFLVRCQLAWGASSLVNYVIIFFKLHNKKKLLNSKMCKMVD